MTKQKNLLCVNKWTKRADIQSLVTYSLYPWRHQTTPQNESAFAFVNMHKQYYIYLNIEFLEGAGS